MRSIFFSLSVFALVIVACASLGMTADAAPEQAPSKTISTTDLEVPLDILKLRLEPLTEKELQAEAMAWQALVQESAHKVAEAAIKSRNTPDDSEDKQAAIEVLLKAREETAARIEQFEVVLDQWEAKGGDAETFRTYAEAVGKGGIDVEDTASTKELIKRKIISTERWIAIGKHFVAFLGIMVLSWIIGRILGSIASFFIWRNKASSTLLDQFVKKFVTRGVVVLGFLLGLMEMGVNLSALLALVGGASFIIAFATQDTLSNFANGLMIVIYQPFDVDDIVEIGGVKGQVESVTLVNTQIRTADSKIVFVPNKSVWGQVITNATTSPNRRVDLVFGIGYDDDIKKAHAVLKKIVDDHELVLDDPEPVIRVHELADSCVNFVCRPWTANDNYWKVYWDITESVKEEFDANGISIPYPQQDVHLQKVAEAG